MIREKAIDATPDRDTDAEHAGERSRRYSIHALREMQIAARPPSRASGSPRLINER